MQPSYWQIQKNESPLYPDIAWNKPERRDQAGNLGIIGGNKLGFVAVGDSYQTALNTGAGKIRVVVPDTLKKVIPPTFTDVTFGASNPSGSLGKDALTEIRALGAWADGILLIGDTGRNSETSILYEEFLSNYSRPLTVTRDAIDALLNSPSALVERDNTLIVVSFAQLQKIFMKVYYPKMITFSMQLSQLVETLHKFTVTYPITVVTYHQDHIIIAHNAKVVTTKWNDPMQIWKGTVATKAATYWLWNPSKPLESITTSLA